MPQLSTSTITLQPPSDGISGSVVWNMSVTKDNNFSVKTSKATGMQGLFVNGAGLCVCRHAR